MNQQLEQALTDLASKLGTTAEHLWSVLVRQAPIDSAINIAVWLLFVATGIVCWRLFRKTYQKAHIEKDYFHDELVPLMVAYFIGALGAGFTVLALAGNYASTTLAGFFNPEYWALKQIIH